MKFKPVYLWALLPVILVVGWFIAFYGPVSAESRVRKNDLTVVMAEKGALEKELNRLAALRKREGETKSRMDSMSADIPRYDDLPAFMRDMVGAAKRKGVRVEDLGSVFSSVEDQRAKPVTNPAFEITVKGRFLQIGGFLEDLERNKAFKGIEKASLSYEDAQYPVLTGKFVIQFKAKRE